MIKQRYLSLSFLLLSLMACRPPVSTDTIVPIASHSLAPASTQPISPSMAEAQATPVVNQMTPAVLQQAEGYPADNSTAKCFAILAYDPDDTFVNLRNQPDGDIIVNLPNFTLLATEPGMAPAFIDSGWNHVHALAQNQSSFISGYVWEDLIRRTYYRVEDPQDTYVNLRESPNGSVAAALANGTEVRFMGEDGTWTRVQLANGQMGYVATALLTNPSCF